MSELWNRAQTFWIHPRIFELIDANNSQRAGQVAINIMKALPLKSLASGENNPASIQQAHYLVAFLWAVENLRATKVSLNEAPTSELFDNRAQEIIGNLDTQRSPSKTPSERDPEEEGSPDNGTQEKGRKIRRREAQTGGPNKRKRLNTDEIATVGAIPQAVTSRSLAGHPQDPDPDRNLGPPPGPLAQSPIPGQNLSQTDQDPNQRPDPELGPNLDPGPDPGPDLGLGQGLDPGEYATRGMMKTTI